MAYGEEEDEIQENDAQGRNAFRDAEKKYQLFRERKMKIKNGRQRAGKLVTRPTDLSEVIDLHDSTRAQATDVVRQVLSDYPGAVYTFTRHPGLVYLPAALPAAQQRQLILAALTDFPQPPARTNHHLQYGPLPDLWRAAELGLRLNWLRKDDPHEGPSTRRMGCGHTPAKPHRLPSPFNAAVPAIAAPATATTAPGVPAPSGNSNDPQPKERVVRDCATQDPSGAGTRPVSESGTTWSQHSPSGVACPSLKDSGAAGGGGGEGCFRCSCGGSGDGNHSGDDNNIRNNPRHHMLLNANPRHHRRRSSSSSCSSSGGGGDSPRSSCSGASEALGEEFEELRLRQQQQQQGQGQCQQGPAGGGGLTGSTSGRPQRLPQQEQPQHHTAGGLPQQVQGRPLRDVTRASGSVEFGIQDGPAGEVMPDSAGAGGEDGYGDAVERDTVTDTVTTRTAAMVGVFVDAASPSFEECWSRSGVGPAAEQLLRKLRWATLGPQFNWTQRQYDFCEPYRPLPASLGALARQLTAVVDRLHDAGLGVLPAGASRGYRPDAAIVNFYQQGDVLGGHLDDVERDMSLPIVSVSLGCPAVFLMGGATKHVAPTALLLRGGDVLVLAGPARSCYHGVPRVLDMDAVSHPTQPSPPPCSHNPCQHNLDTAAAASGPQEEGEWSPRVEAYARVARINISVRAVL